MFWFKFASGFFETMPYKHTSNHLPLFREVLTGNEKPFKS